MDYFNDAIGFIRKNPLRSLIIFVLDIVFYVLFIPISNLCVDLFFKQLTKIPISTMGAIMQSMEVEALRQLQFKLLGVFTGIIGTVLFFFLLALLNISILKGVIWFITLKKNIDYKILLKSVLLHLLMAAIFSILFILAAIPFIGMSKDYALTQVLNVHFSDYILLIIVSVIAIYFFTLSQYFLIKEGKFRRALKNSFTLGFTQVGKLVMPFAALFIMNAAIVKILGNLGILQLWIGLIISFFFILMTSFFNRIYISKAI